LQPFPRPACSFPLLRHSGHSSTVLPLRTDRAIRIELEKQVQLALPAPRTNSTRSFARSRCLPRKRKRGNSLIESPLCSFPLSSRPRPPRLWPEENRKSLVGSSGNKFHFVMIAFSLPDLPIITGKLHVLNLHRLFSNLATFSAFGLLTRFSFPASRCQIRPHCVPRVATSGARLPGAPNDGSSSLGWLTGALTALLATLLRHPLCRIRN
jgi:hypothetical protein